MIDADAIVAPQATPATRLDKSIERYEKTLDELESTNNPSFEQIVEVIVARDVVETRREKDKNPSGASIARVIKLDSRLQDQREAIATNPELAKYIDQLLEWRENLNLSSNPWWWQMITDLDTLLNQAVEEYKQALSELGDVRETSTEKILAVLQARDKVAQLCRGEKKLPQEEIAKIMDLDDRLWDQAFAINKVINNNEKLDPWNDRFQSPLDSWWWQLGTEEPDFIEYVNDYKEVLQDVQNLKFAADASEEDQEKKVLQLLKARDAVETAMQEQSSIPERIAKILINLDEDLKDVKQKPWVRTTGKRLRVWKKMLKQEESHWWWDFKLSIFGEENEPMRLKDRFWILGALACIVVGAGIAANTTQTFQTFVQEEDAVQSDILQNSLVLVQGAGLVSLGGATVTQKGRKLIENVIDDLTFIPQSWHARATFGLSVAALGMVYGINQSLPQIGNWYLERGQNYLDEGQLFQAEGQFRQAKKLFEDAEAKAKVSLQLGKVYEDQQDFEKAIEEYNSVLATNNPEVILNLGRAMVFQESEEVAWTEKIEDETIRQAENYFVQVKRMIAKGGTGSKESNSNKNQDAQQSVQTDRLTKELHINQGILAWAKVDFNQNSWDQSELERAQFYFNKAKDLDTQLPTTPDSRNVRCYLELAEALINREQASEQAWFDSYCGKIYYRGNIENRSEANLMKSIAQLLDIDLFSE